jgi:Trk K+ transport system NAD-binding subunit
MDQPADPRRRRQQARGSTVLEEGDEVLLLGASDELAEMFEGPERVEA